MSETCRLFFALWPDPTVREQLARLGRAVASSCRGRPVPWDNLHLTLAFLGQVSREQVPCIEGLGDTLSGEPFVLTLDQLGFFPRAGVVWAGCSQVPEALTRLQLRLNESLPQCGLEPESRPFRPHLTLLRKARRGPGAAPVSPVEWPVSGFALVASALNAEGALYSVCRRWSLSAGAEPPPG